MCVLSIFKLVTFGGLVSGFSFMFSLLLLLLLNIKTLFQISIAEKDRELPLRDLFPLSPLKAVKMAWTVLLAMANEMYQNVTVYSMEVL